MARPDLGRLIAQTMAQPAEGRTIETITGEILELKRKGGQVILDIGRRLIEAKDMLSHGEWLPWLNEQVEFSERTAQKFMKLSREWSNPSTLADLGASKALMLLALPEEEREHFMENNNVIDMSARQLEQAIRERDEARAAAEHAAAEQRTAEEARAKMEEDMRLLNARLAGSKEDREQAMQAAQKLQETLHDVLEDRSDAYQRLEKITEELDELKARPVEVAVETVVDQEAIDKARDEAVAEMQAKLDKARKAQQEAETVRRELEAALADTHRRLEEEHRAEKRAALGADKDVAQFEVLFIQGQELAHKMQGYLLKARDREDQTAAKGMEKAILALADLVRGCAK